MKLTTIEVNSLELKKEFLKFPETIYQKSINRTLYVNKLKETFNFSNFKHFLVKKNQKTVAIFSTGSNELLKDEENNIFGLIGFLESVNDFEIFSFAMKTALQQLKAFKTILYPFFNSTWHFYRLLKKKDFNLFLDAPFLDYNSKFIEKFGFLEKIEYKTSKCLGLKELVDSTKEKYEKSLNAGITYRNLNKNNIEKELKTLYEISIKGFKDNKFYTPINFKEFQKLYGKNLALIDEKFVVIAEKNNKPVGFNFSIPDYTTLLNRFDISSIWGKLMFLMKKRSSIDGFLIKSTAVIPEMRNKYIHNGAIYLIAKEALKRNYNHYIGSYYITTNVSARFLKNIESENIYELYVLKN